MWHSSKLLRVSEFGCGDKGAKCSLRVAKVMRVVRWSGLQRWQGLEGLQGCQGF